MTDFCKLTDFNVGDTIYYCKEINWGWKSLGVAYIKDKIIKMTPKKTKLITENGLTIEKKNHPWLFKTRDQEMISISLKSLALLKVYHYLHKVTRYVEKGDIENLSRAEIEKFRDYLKDACNIIEKPENKEE